MADDKEKPRPFDVETIRDLVRLMSRHDLSEIDLAWGDERIRLRRGARLIAGPAPVVQALPSALPSTPAAAPTGAAPAPAAPAAPTRKLIEIKSPTVGTFYAQREPGSPPFVTAGSRVTPTTVVCLIEAMKVYNDVTADCTGVIAEVCVKDRDFVEYNTVLFRVDPTG
ncbi:MAG: biotin/lipoyl-containing protein [Gemmataceae bacterium]